jgi:hypothetical protein
MTLQILSALDSERAAEDREVLREHVHRPARDRPRAADHAVARDQRLLHAEVAAAVNDEGIELEEGAGVEQQRDPLVRRQLALGVLALDAGGASALQPALAQGLEVGDAFFEGHRVGRKVTGRFPAARRACA